MTPYQKERRDESKRQHKLMGCQLFPSVEARDSYEQHILATLDELKKAQSPGWGCGPAYDLSRKAYAVLCDLLKVTRYARVP